MRTISGRIMAAVLALLLTAALAPAFAQEGASALTSEELAAWREILLRDSIRGGAYQSAVLGDGRYSQALAWYTLITDTERLSSATRILEVHFEHDPDAANTPADIHGLRVGDSLKTVLSAWPDENENLAGTREEAVLYAYGRLPGQAAYGLLERSGQRVEAIVHRHYAMTSAGVSVSEVRYHLQDGFVDRITVLFDSQTLSMQDAAAEMEAVRELQSTTEFSAYAEDTDAPAVFGRDDMIFSGIDFLDMTPDGLIAILGDEYAEEWAREESGSIRVLEWHAMAAAFRYGKDDTLITVDNIYMNEDLLIGPRGLTVGDTLDTVLSRFPNEAGVADGIHQPLYGTEADGDYAVMDSVYPGTAELRYVCRTADEQSVMMILYVENGVVTQIVLQML